MTVALLTALAVFVIFEGGAILGAWAARRDAAARWDFTSEGSTVHWTVVPSKKS